MDCFGALALLAMTMRPSLHLHLQPFFFDDGSELHRLSLHEVAELLRRAVIRPRAHGRDVLLDVVTLEHGFDLPVERDDIKKNIAPMGDRKSTLLNSIHT